MGCGKVILRGVDLDSFMVKFIFSFLLPLLFMISITNPVLVLAVDKATIISGGGGNQFLQDVQLNTTSVTGAPVGGERVTNFNLSGLGASLKWQGYVGGVEANLLLGASTGAYTYNFGAARVDQVKTVFASTNNNFDFSQLSNRTPVDLDTVLNWVSTDFDSAKKMFIDAQKTIARERNVKTSFLNSFIENDTIPNNFLANVSNIYLTGIFSNDVTPLRINSFAFAAPTNTSPGNFDFRNSTFGIHYELIVPVNGSVETQTYYFYLDVE